MTFHIHTSGSSIKDEKPRDEIVCESCALHTSHALSSLYKYVTIPTTSTPLDPNYALDLNHTFSLHGAFK